MHNYPSRNQCALSAKTMADIVHVKPMTETDVRNRFAPTLSDWTEQEQAFFTKTVVASHGWTYHNAMAAMAIQ